MKTKILEKQKYKNYHFIFVGFAEFKKVFKALSENMPYYRFASQGKSTEKEIFYDVADDLLSNNNIALSKWYNEGKIYFQIRRLSRAANGEKGPTKKYLYGTFEEEDEPKDYSFQLASAIENSFDSSFSVDLDAILRQAKPKMEAVIEANRYEIICGTGYRANMEYEKATYKDLKTGKKAVRIGLTFKFPLKDEEETQEILDIIDRKVKGLAISDLSRFEVAKQVLYSTYQEEANDSKTDEEDEEN